MRLWERRTLDPQPTPQSIEAMNAWADLCAQEQKRAPIKVSDYVMVRWEDHTLRLGQVERLRDDAMNNPPYVVRVFGEMKSEVCYRTDFRRASVLEILAGEAEP